MSTHISDHFSWLEARCHDGTEVPAELQPNARRLALTVLEPLRAVWGGPLVAISWYRTQSYNDSLREAARKAGRIPGTAKESQHTTGGAVDIRPVSPLDLPRFYTLIESMVGDHRLSEIGGLGYYPGLWVHLDVREKVDGRVCRWVGAGVAAEMAG